MSFVGQTKTKPIKPHMTLAQVALRLYGEYTDATRKQIQRDFGRGKFPGAYKAGDATNSPIMFPEESVIEFEKTSGKPD